MDSVAESTQNFLNPNAGAQRPIPRMKVHGNDNKSTYQFIRKADAAERIAPRDITRGELRQHNTREDCWMAVEGMVYECTEYLAYHPGGDKLLLGAGKDATSLYKKYHPWVNHAALIGKYYRGNLIN